MYFPVSTSQKTPRRRRGYTLVELSLVTLILGIMAAVAIPGFISTDPAKLNLAAREFADAMRFARSEAMRLREPHGFRQSSTNKRLRLFSVDASGSPWAEVYDVYHPLSKKAYDIILDEHSFASADAMTAMRQYRGSCNRINSVYFDAQGIPRCLDPETVLLDQFEIVIKSGGHQRVVSLEPITGRVSVQ